MLERNLKSNLFDLSRAQQSLFLYRTFEAFRKNFPLALPVVNKKKFWTMQKQTQKTGPNHQEGKHIRNYRVSAGAYYKSNE